MNKKNFYGIPRMINYVGIWQCVGMIVGVYGVGYWIAASDPQRHWPIVLVGFLGKIFGPIGFIQAYMDGIFNSKFGLTIITNDLIWWIPFYLILLSSKNEIKKYLATNNENQ
jgi:small multidrug resistance pump